MKVSKAELAKKQMLRDSMLLQDTTIKAYIKLKHYTDTNPSVLYEDLTKTDLNVDYVKVLNMFFVNFRFQPKLCHILINQYINNKGAFIYSLKAISKQPIIKYKLPEKLPNNWSMTLTIFVVRTLYKLQVRDALLYKKTVNSKKIYDNVMRMLKISEEIYELARTLLVIKNK